MKKSPDEIQLFTLFSREYGIISVKKKIKAREKSLDIGYLIHAEIHTKENRNTHTFWNIKIKSRPVSEKMSFQEIELFLQIIVKIKQELPLWNPHYEIYDALSYVIENTQIQTYESLILLALKIQSILWNLWETHTDMSTQKILKFVHSHHIQHILKLKNIPKETLEYVKTQIQV